jgi:hypothetical protein
MRPPPRGAAAVPPPPPPLSVRADKALRTAAKAAAPLLPRRLSRSFPESFAASSPAKRRAALHALVRNLALVVLPAVLLLSSVGSFVRHRVGGATGGAVPQFVPLAGHREAVLGERSGASLVVACQDQHERLAKALPSWLAARQVDEIVLVDWSSRPALSTLVGGTDRVRVVRVAGEAAWSAARAYNLGVALALYDRVALVRCGGHVDASLVEAAAVHVPTSAPSPERAAWFGRGRAVLCRRAFKAVGGYSEAASHGSAADWRPDGDLSLRLTAAGYAVHTAEAAPDAAVGEDGAASQIDSLRATTVLALLRAQGGQSSPAPAAYKVVDEVPVPFLRRRLWAASLRLPSTLEAMAAGGDVAHTVLEEAVDRAWSDAVGRQLHDVHGVCWDLMLALDGQARERLWENVLSRQTGIRDDVAASSAAAGLSPALLAEVIYDQPRLLVVHVMHGLGNRLRALASAMAFAASTGRILVVVWERDAHCGALLGDLFELHAPRGLVVVDQFPLRWAQFGHIRAQDAVWRDWDAYNYMAMEGGGALKDAPVVDDPSKHIYFKSAYVLVAAAGRLTGWELANVQLARLRPVARVTALVEAHVAAAAFDDNTVGVHMRSLGLDEESGIDALREYGADDSGVLSYWRARSRPATFHREMSALVDADPATRFFVASDSAAAVEEARRLFPGRVDSMKGAACDGRRTECLQTALADMIVLGRTRRMLGSPWSSFTEGARRFGCREVRVAGTDFGFDAAAGAREEPLSPAVVAMLARVRAKAEKKKRKDGVKA